MRNPRAIEKVVILGGGTAGWMTAAALARLIPSGVQITLVESDAIGTVGVGEATIPSIREFNAFLGIDERSMLACTQGSIKLGIEFVGWREEGERYFHPFGGHGLDLDGTAFYALWHRMRAAGRAADLQQYSLNAVAAREGRFVPADPDPRSLRSRLLHAYHFDAARYARMLRDYAEQRGVVRIEARVEGASLRPDNGFIDSLLLQDGRTMAGELFVDCSGFAARLIGQALEVSYDDWRHWLPCDRAIAVPTASIDPLPPYTRATACPVGWQWRIPLQHRTGNGLVYSSAHLTGADAEALLLDRLETPALGEPRHLRFVTGARAEAWSRNCVAIGLAAGFLEPLESTSIHLIQTGITRLLALFPDRRWSPVDRDLYNQHTRDQFEAVRDVIILHYALNNRPEPFWQAARSTVLPTSLEPRLAMYRRRGRVFPRSDELFAEASWLSILSGQGGAPEGWDAVADSADMEQLDAIFARMKDAIRQNVSQMPGHSDYLVAARL